MDRFPSLERERLESSSEQQRSRSSSSSKLQDPNHTREVIFALPSLQLHLKTEHLQAAKTPDVAGLLVLLIQEQEIDNKILGGGFN